MIVTKTNYLEIEILQIQNHHCQKLNKALII